MSGVDWISWLSRGLARTQVPTTRNCTVELPTFVVIAGVSPTGLQWKGLTLEETPCWSSCLPRQVSMKCTVLWFEPGSQRRSWWLWEDAESTGFAAKIHLIEEKHEMRGSREGCFSWQAKAAIMSKKLLCAGFFVRMLELLFKQPG